MLTELTFISISTTQKRGFHKVLLLNPSALLFHQLPVVSKQLLRCTVSETSTYRLITLYMYRTATHIHLADHRMPRKAFHCRTQAETIKCSLSWRQQKTLYESSFYPHHRCYAPKGGATSAFRCLYLEYARKMVLTHPWLDGCTRRT